MIKKAQTRDSTSRGPTSAYDPAQIESKWQKKWAKDKIYKTQEAGSRKKGEWGEKYYILDMFPYPSGEGLHVGHPKGYIATDIISRMKRMQGMNVLHPMGFDAFGLPAENYAIKMKINPDIAVKKNVARFKEQLELIGLDYDWSREVNTTDPEYYRWTQWIFLQLFKKGLAYESYEPVNWCPTDKTVLANEDVENGRCERCGTPIEKKALRQWVLRITDYADRLLRDLDAKNLDGASLLDWPESIKEAQRNWIGRSEGALIKFEIRNTKYEGNPKSENQNSKKENIEVFTTRPDTLFGVTYVVLAPEHKLVNELLGSIPNKPEVEAYIANAKKETEIERTDAKKEKTGVELKGIKAVNPVNKEEVPVYIADYVLADYGTGAVMAVPAHDDRDWAFAKKFGLKIKEVVLPYFENKLHPVKKGLPIVSRKHVNCILRDPKTDRYACLKWNKDLGWTTMVGGGVEKDEDVVAAGKRELTEESGYAGTRFVKEVGRCFGGGFAAHKNENRFSENTCLLFDLTDQDQGKISEEELAKHELVWLNKSEVADFLNVESSQYLWSLYLNGDHIYTGDGMLIDSGSFSGKSSESVKKEITEFAGGRSVTKYKLRDWVFSRQRYWGEPIPLIHCEKCGVVPIPEKDLPVKLPKVESYEPTGTGESPLAAIKSWVNVKCPKCKGPAKRETNTMPQWAGSCWYYLRYEDPKNRNELVAGSKEKYWSPVDLYVGGAEHATRHLIYARFWHKFLNDIGVVSTSEPFTKLQSVGLIMGEDGRKMSKRFGNVVNPDDIVKIFGADTLRIYEMFMGPFDQSISWSTESMVGPRRFIERVWKLAGRVEETPRRSLPESVKKVDTLKETHGEHIIPHVASVSETASTGAILHRTIKKVTEDISAMRFNTAISSLMIASNEIEKAITDAKSPAVLSRTDFESYLKLLAPFAPHVTEELWTTLGNKKSIHISEWPKYDPKLIVNDEANIVVQINGKVRSSFKAAVDLADNELEAKALALPEAKKWLEGKSVKKVIVIKGKLVSIVVV
jgi:leucyl-tRNA synthetase